MAAGGGTGVGVVGGVWRTASRALAAAAESAGVTGGAEGGGWLSMIFWRIASRALICSGVSFARTASVVVQTAAQATRRLLEICIPPFYVKVPEDATR